MNSGETRSRFRNPPPSTLAVQEEQVGRTVEANQVPKQAGDAADWQAENLCAALRARHSGKLVELRNMVALDAADLDKERVVVVLVSTWSQGAAPSNAKFFTEWLSPAPSNSIAGSTTSSCSASASTCSASATLHTRTRATSIASERPCIDLLLLGTAPLMPLSLGNVSGSVDVAFSRWRTSTTC